MSRIRTGAPPTFLMMIWLNSGTSSSRPIVRTPSSEGPRTMRPPGDSMFSVSSARRISCGGQAVRGQLVQIHHDVDLALERAAISTAATPSTVSSARRTCLSAISVSSRAPRWPLTDNVMTGSESGSAF